MTPQNEQQEQGEGFVEKALRRTLYAISARALGKWERLGPEGQRDEIDGVFNRFTEKFNTGLGPELAPFLEYINPLTVFTAGNLQQGLESSMINQDMENTKSITLLDADGVFINFWLNFQKFIGPISNKLENENIGTIEEVIKLLSQDSPDFLNDVFDLRGLEYLNINLNNNHFAAVTTDRYEHFPFFRTVGWFETPALKLFFQSYLNNIQIFTNMKRSKSGKGGNDETFPDLEIHLRDQIKSAYTNHEIDDNKNLIIRLVSDIKSLDKTKTPGTGKADRTGNEGLFLARVVKSAKLILNDLGFSNVKIEPQYIGINPLLNKNVIEI